MIHQYTLINCFVSTTNYYTHNITHTHVDGGGVQDGSTKLDFCSRQSIDPNTPRKKDDDMKHFSFVFVSSFVEVMGSHLKFSDPAARRLHCVCAMMMMNSSALIT